MADSLFTLRICLCSTHCYRYSYHLICLCHCPRPRNMTSSKFAQLIEKLLLWLQSVEMQNVWGIGIVSRTNGDEGKRWVEELTWCHQTKKRTGIEASEHLLMPLSVSPAHRTRRFVWRIVSLLWFERLTYLHTVRSARRCREWLQGFSVQIHCHCCSFAPSFSIYQPPLYHSEHLPFGVCLSLPTSHSYK